MITTAVSRADRLAARSSSSRPERPGHADVEEGDVEAPPGERLERGVAGVDVDDLVARVLERLAQHEADRRLVVGDQTRARRRLRSRRAPAGALRSGSDAHARALARRALDVQRAAVLRHPVLREREAEARCRRAAW